jgi:glycosyl-4,4'-diaponeurosporenoate acyltransferase
MRILYLPDTISILLCFVIWPVFQVLAALLCKRLPDQFLKPRSFYFRAHRWEKSGRFYEHFLRIKKWKRLLPDGGAAFKDGYRKKHLTDLSEKNLERFLVESCRAELTHLLAIPPVIVFGLFVPPFVIPIMLLYALAVNAPCMAAQRYNRPRVTALLEKRRIRRQRVEIM